MSINLSSLKTKKVLFAEDDIITRNQTGEILKMIFAQVYLAEDGEEALRIYEDEKPDILISDIKMPKCDGLSLIRKIRKVNYSLPIILMTSFAELNFLINAANLSIDGYLVKPVSLDQLTTALSRAVKRNQTEEQIYQLAHNLYYNPSTQELFQNGKIVILGLKELEMLILLVNNHHRTVSKEEIANVLWPFDSICESAIKNLILRIRKKIDSDIITSVRGVGYRLDILNIHQTI